jgi:hypothetical protein
MEEEQERQGQEEQKRQEELIEEYISQLTEVEKIAYEIAKEHLGTSFNIRRSNGFKEWLKKK